MGRTEEGLLPPDIGMPAPRPIACPRGGDLRHTLLYTRPPASAASALSSKKGQLLCLRHSLEVSPLVGRPPTTGTRCRP